MNTSKIRILPLASCLLAISANAQITTNLIGYWQFEDNLTETSGTHAAGLHDGVEHGTNPVGYVANSNADFGQALDLDGTNGVIVNNSSNLDVDGVTANPTYATTFDADINTANAMTVSCWVSGAITSSWSPFIAKNGESLGWQLRRQSGSAAAVLTARGTEGAADPGGSNTAATDTVWRHIVAVWDGSGSGTRRIFIDGVEDTTFAAGVGASDISTGGPGDAIDKLLTFGMRDNGAATFVSNFTGQIDDVAIWSRALTDTEVLQLSVNPLSVVLVNTDTDGDGLFDAEETSLDNGYQTDPLKADTDDDGVDDFVETAEGSDPTVDNDFDMDGLVNSKETSGDDNPFSNETTLWNVADSDGDGILDGEEVIAGVDGYVTNPNSADTDADDWSDGDEVNADPASDPNDPDSYPSTATGLIGYWAFEDNLQETSGVHPVGLHDGFAVDQLDAAIAEAYIEGPSADFGQALDLRYTTTEIVDEVEVVTNVIYGVKVANSQDDETDYAPTFDADVNAANAMSVSFWSNGGLSRWSPVLAKYGEDDATNGVGGWQVRRQNNNSDMTFTLRNTTGAPDPRGGNTAAVASGWKHVLVTWDGSGSGSRKIYIDGVEDTTFTGNVPSDLSAGGPGDALDKFLTFGMRDNGLGGLVSFFNGDIDDVAIWSRSLTPSEARLLSVSPLSKVLVNIDTDGDGLFDADEISLDNGYETDPLKPDTDDDGVNDFDEMQAGSNPTVDNDFDLDGLLNSQEISGSLNTAFSNEPTLWNVADSDVDGVNDGDEVLNTNGSVTNPNDPDTDLDGFTDGAEIHEGSDPTNPADTGNLNEWQRSLTGYWALDDNLNDSGYIGADGVMAGTELTANYVAGKFGKAVDLDKTNGQHVMVTGDENYFDTVGSDMTVSIWITAEALNDNWQGIFSKGEQSWRLARRGTSDGAAFAAGVGADAPATDATANAYPINDGGWHHLVGVAKWGESFSLYMDGTLIETRDILPNLTNVPERVLIGSNPTTERSWNGNIDDAAMWKRALSAEEIYTMYSNGNAVQFLIENDVPVEAIPDAILAIESSGFDEAGTFHVELSGMTVANTYTFRVTESIDPEDLFWFELDSVTGVKTHIFSEDNPTDASDTGFYSVLVEEPVAP